MLFLAPEDAETHGFLLSSLYDRLPREFLGVKTEHRSRQGNGRYGVKTTEQFLLEQTGLFHTPETWREWMAIPSYALAAACAGEIFHDGSGDMTGIRETLRTGMPEDVRVKKIAGHAALMAQSGQYNVSRCRRHGEEAAARLACCEFVNHTLAMLFLLNERHMPFYKWAFRAAKELPKLSELIPTLEALLREPDEDTIERVSAAVIEELRAQGLTDGGWDFLEPHAYAVMRRIRNPEIAALHIMEV